MVAHVCNSNEPKPKTPKPCPVAEQLWPGFNTSHRSINMPTTTFSVPNRTNIHLTWLLLVSSQIWTGTGTGTETGHGVATGSVVGLDGLGSLWCGHFLIWFRYLLSHTFYYLIYQSSCWMPNAAGEVKPMFFLYFVCQMQMSVEVGNALYRPHAPPPAWYI